mmetsp:Transcript_9153/g.20641  ORF Transcript_9153/g.20641 Transcript_9153/m.20641 type:complete len:159 (-) Transcript_9153:488-964(-)
MENSSNNVWGAPKDLPKAPPNAKEAAKAAAIEASPGVGRRLDAKGSECVVSARALVTTTESLTVASFASLTPESVVRFAAEESAKLQEKIEEMEAKKTRLDAVLEKAEKSKKSNKDLVARRDEIDSEQAVTEAQLKEQKQQPAYFFNKHLDSGDPSHG